MECHVCGYDMSGRRRGDLCPECGTDLDDRPNVLGGKWRCRIASVAGTSAVACVVAAWVLVWLNLFNFGFIIFVGLVLGIAGLLLGKVHDLDGSYRATRQQRIQLRVGFVCGLVAVIGFPLMFISMCGLMY